MKQQISSQHLSKLGFSKLECEKIAAIITQEIANHHDKQQAWPAVANALLAHGYPFEAHIKIFELLFPAWEASPGSAAAWQPTQQQIKRSNMKKFMEELDIETVHGLHQFSRDHYRQFWQRMINKLEINFKKLPMEICDLSLGAKKPKWLPGAKINIVDSCLQAPPSQIAIIYQDPQGQRHDVSFQELSTLTNRIANTLLKAGLNAGDEIAIIMPMNLYAVASYLAIIKLGGVVVSIADSFSSEEMATRLQIANTKAVITQDYIGWNNKKIPLYTKLIEASAPKCFILPLGQQLNVQIRKHDKDLLKILSNNGDFNSLSCDPMSSCNILFSSGTTGTPKAIPWNHVTAIKPASDAYLHHNIMPGDVLAWPTNLGWMMGPWLIFAALINHATIALYSGAPKGKEYGKFIEESGTTMLGVVPTLVADWRQSQCMEGLDWNKIKCFSSTGECSNPEDMFYLMWLAGYKPIIEYCGGTEIGGAYVTSTMIQNNYPSVFTTAAMGSDFIILDDADKPSDQGEVCIIPPSLGLSVSLLNADHDKVYFDNMPTFNNVVLRRHGDQITRLDNDMYSILGRVDDTMNLGGIKISSAEIERVLCHVDSVKETAAIAIKSPSNGPSQLVIYAAIENSNGLDKETTITNMQKKINHYLNPLFKIHDLVFVEDLPKTASNKIMRRVLRDKYLSNNANSKR